MGLSIKNDEVEAMARDLARRHGTGVTEIIKIALKEKAEREGKEPPLWERVQPILQRLEQAGRRLEPGVPLDRSFYDDLSGET